MNFYFRSVFVEICNHSHFFETYDPTEFRNQCFHFHRKLFGRHLGYSKWPPSESQFCPLFFDYMRYDDKFGDYPYILGVTGNDGTILNIFG